MTDADPYQAWLDDFKREIDALTAKPPAPGPAAAGRSAQAAFSSWWQSEIESLAGPPTPKGLVQAETKSQDSSESSIQEQVCLQEYQLQAQRQSRAFAKKAYENLEVHAQALEAGLRRELHEFLVKVKRIVRETAGRQT